MYHFSDCFICIFFHCIMHQTDYNENWNRIISEQRWLMERWTWKSLKGNSEIAELLMWILLYIFQKSGKWADQHLMGGGHLAHGYQNGRSCVSDFIGPNNYLLYLMVLNSRGINKNKDVLVEWCWVPVLTQNTGSGNTLGNITASDDVNKFNLRYLV